MSGACSVDLSLPIGYGLSPKEFVRLSVHAEAEGLGAACVGEMGATDSMALLSAIAMSTSTLRLETSVVAVTARSASLMSMSAATLQDLSDGRFVLGLGAGSPIVAGFHGREFSKPLGAVESAVTAIRTVLGGGTCRELGSFRLRGITPTPTPIYVSAMNTGMVKLAGRVADGMILNFCAEAQVRSLNELARSARTTSDPFATHAVLWLYAGDDPEGAREQFKVELAPYLAVPTYRNAAVALAGEEAVARVESAWRAEGRQAGAKLFPDAIVDALLALGTVEDVAARVSSMAEAGCAGVRFTPIVKNPADYEANAEVVSFAGSVKRRIEEFSR